MMQAPKNIIVTGSEKGMGQGIVKKMAEKEGWNIIMAVFDLTLGKIARTLLLSLHPYASIHIERLDVSDSKSIDQFVEIVKQKYQPIHVLVNGAVVAATQEAFDSEVIRWTFQTNFYGNIEFSEKMLPLLADHGKIISMGSIAGKRAYAKLKGQGLRSRWRKQDLNKEQLFELVHDFEDGVAKDNYAQRGWPRWVFGVSSLAINVYHQILGRDPEILKRNIQVYVCFPGQVKNSILNPAQVGFLAVEQAIHNPVYLIELPFKVNEKLQGGLVYLQRLVKTIE